MKNNQKTAIEVKNIRLTFGREEIYEDVSFSVAPGELICILGPSGCGKSTLLRLFGGLIQPSGGEVFIDGQTPDVAWSKIAYVFQSPRLLPWRTTLGNVNLAKELRDGKISKAEEEGSRHLLDMVGLSRDVDKYPAMLSGGERQRVAIARALSVNPDIILMDEPLSALDIITRQKLRAEILSLWQRTGKTIVFVTHDIDDALALAGRVLVLSRKPSRIVEDIRIQEAHPRSLEDASLADVRKALEGQFRVAEAA